MSHRHGRPLCRAAEGGSLPELARLHARQRASPGRTNQAPPFVAACCGHAAVGEWLAGRGTNPSQPSKCGVDGPPWSHSISMHRPEVAELVRQRTAAAPAPAVQPASPSAQDPALRAPCAAAVSRLDSPASGDSGSSRAEAAIEETVRGPPWLRSTPGGPRSLGSWPLSARSTTLACSGAAAWPSRQCSSSLLASRGRPVAMARPIAGQMVRGRGGKGAWRWVGSCFELFEPPSSWSKDAFRPELAPRLGHLQPRPTSPVRLARPPRARPWAGAGAGASSASGTTLAGARAARRPAACSRPRTAATRGPTSRPRGPPCSASGARASRRRSACWPPGAARRCRSHGQRHQSDGLPNCARCSRVRREPAAGPTSGSPACPRAAGASACFPPG